MSFVWNNLRLENVNIKIKVILDRFIVEKKTNDILGVFTTEMSSWEFPLMLKFLYLYIYIIANLWFNC